MAYNNNLADRIRSLLSKHKGIEEKKMFGGLGLMLNGNMCCGVHENEMIVRVDPKFHAEFLSKPNIREFDLSGRSSSKGWLLLTAEGCASEKSLGDWVSISSKYTHSLPPKKPKLRK